MEKFIFAVFFVSIYFFAMLFFALLFSFYIWGFFAMPKETAFLGGFIGCGWWFFRLKNYYKKNKKEGE